LPDAPEDWKRVKDFMHRLFRIRLGDPAETPRGAVTLEYQQEGAKTPFDLSQAGRGLQQMLLVLAYLYAHRGSIVLVDEPDAHLEILRQRQIYVLLRDVARESGSQIVMATHSEVILDAALDTSLVLLLEGRADDLAQKADIKNALKHFGAEHYVRARQRGYVLYVEGGTDIDMLQALARRLNHPAAKIWDERVNAFYVQDNYPLADTDSELERVEGGFGITPRAHFNALRNLLPGLKGLAVLDNDGKNRQDADEGGLSVRYWRRYEAENYFVTPTLLAAYAKGKLGMPLFNAVVDQVLDDLVRERVFGNRTQDFDTWRNATVDAQRLIWDTATRQIKLSDFAEEFFRQVAAQTNTPMLLRKGGLHELVGGVDPASINSEVGQKLDALVSLFSSATPEEAP
jgi:AAA domain, putative AbiEii toxin, Type IV TA system